MARAARRLVCQHSVVRALRLPLGSTTSAVGELCDKFCRFTAQITNAAQATATMEAVDEVEHANDLATVARPLVLE